MKRDRTIWQVVAILGLGALGYFVLPGQDHLAAIIAVVVGLLLAIYTFDPNQFAGAPFAAAFARILVTALIGMAITWVIKQEVGRAGLGSMGVALVTMAYAIGGMFVGVALGMIWNARKLLK